MQYFQEDSIDNLEIIRGRIDSIRRNAGMTQKEFAEALGISQSAVSKYLSGRMPPADVMLKIARLGFTTVEWILTGKELPAKRSEDVIHEDSIPYEADMDNFTAEYSELPPAMRIAIKTILSHCRNRQK